MSIVDGGLEVVLSRALGRAVISLKGDLDVHTSPQLRDDLLARIDAGERNIVLDVRNLRFIDSSGLTVLVTAYKRVQATGGELRISGPTPDIFKVMEVSGLTRLVPITRT